MVKRSDVFPSRYLKEPDLGGKPLQVEVERAPQEELGRGDDKEEKTVLHFRGMSKVLPLNITNWDSVAEITGDDTNDWPGARLELYPDKTQLHGKTVPCIRIRAPRQKELLRPQQPPSRPKGKITAAANADMDDDIPF